MNKFYFPHDLNARSDKRILQLRFKFKAEGYGLWNMLLESMAEDSEGYINKAALSAYCMDYAIAEQMLCNVLDYCVEVGLLKQCEHGNYYNTRMLEYKKFREDISEKRRNSAKIKWSDANAMQMHSKCNANAMLIKERKGKEINKTSLDEGTQVLEDKLQINAQPLKPGFEPRALLESSELSPPPKRKCLFQNSKWYDFKTFREALPKWTEEKCMDYYDQANDYSLSKAGMYIDWPAAMRQWERRKKQFSKPLYGRQELTDDDTRQSIKEKTEYLKAKKEGASNGTD